MTINGKDFMSTGFSCISAAYLLRRLKTKCMFMTYGVAFGKGRGTSSILNLYAFLKGGAFFSILSGTSGISLLETLSWVTTSRK